MHTVSVRTGLLLSVVLLTLLPVLTAAPAHAQVFQPLGDLPDGSVFFSSAWDVSSDGSVVVGYSYSSSGREAFRWTAEGGIQGLGGREATSVSADGSVVVGYRFGSNGLEAVRWTSGSIEPLSGFSNDDGSRANDVSADGAVIVGNLGEGWEAFRWTAADGAIGLGTLSGDVFSEAWAVSADGGVVVGSSRGEDQFDPQAYRWTAASGMVGLGDLAGGNVLSQAHGVSADGAVVVGYSNSSRGNEAFRWTERGGMQPLDDLDGGVFSSKAYGTSADGSVVVGQGASDVGATAFIWTEEDGIQSLQAILEDDYGADLTGWQLRRASGISDDGTVIVGFGTNPQGQTEAWRAELGVATWLDPVSGFFNEPTRWSIDDIPAEPHVVRFDAATSAAYTVTFVQDETTRALTVDSTQVAFDLGGATYTLAETDGEALRVGVDEDRPAVLDLYGGGTLAAEDAVVGEGPGSSGFLGVGLETPATLDLAGVLTVGARGTGELDVTDGGGTVTVRRGLLVGEQEGSTGTVSVADGLLQVTEGTLLSAVGLAGTGTLDVIGGTLSLVGPVNVGSGPSGNGTLTLTAGASGTTHNALQVGVAGVGGLEVTGGAGLTSADVTLGLQPGSFGTALVAGAGSRWEVSGTMRVGHGGAALLQIQDGATVCVNTFAYSIGPQGSVHVVGTVVVGEVTTCPPAVVGKGGPSAGRAEARLITPSLVLAEGATLEAEALLLEEGGTLSSDVALALPITNSGIVAPGGPDSSGVFTVEADYVQAAHGTLAIEVQGPTPGSEHDVLAVAGAATLGGTLHLSLLDSFTPQIGDAFTILTADSVRGAFDAVEVAGAPEGHTFGVAYGLDGVVVTLEATPERPAVPVLIAPEDGRADVAVDVELVWDAVPGATSYDVQVAAAPDFSATVLDTTGLTDTTFALTDLREGTPYFWRVRAANAAGAGDYAAVFDFTTRTDVSTEDEVAPDVYSLEQNYPNPFSASTRIAFALPEPAHVVMRVHDMLGRDVRTLANGRYGRGRHNVVFDADELPSGMYVYQMYVGNQIYTRTLVVLK